MVSKTECQSTLKLLVHFHDSISKEAGLSPAFVLLRIEGEFVAHSFVIRTALCISSLFILISCHSKKNSALTDLDDGVRLFDPQELSDYLQSQKLSQKQRLTSIETLRTSMQNSYIGYNVKKKLMGLSGDEVFDHCLQTEKKYSEPISSFEFMDHIHACLALFQDGHVSAKQPYRPTNVTTGIAYTYLSHGEVYVANLRTKLLTAFDLLNEQPEGTLENQLFVGQKIISIDGVPARQALEEIVPLISGSTLKYRQNLAADLLFTRGRAYPTKKSVDLVLESKTGERLKISMPWVITSNQASTLESRLHLHYQGLKTYSEYGFSTASASGFVVQDPIFSLEEVQTYNDSTESLTLKTGYTQVALESSKQKVCYLGSYNFDVAASGEIGSALFKEGDSTALEYMTVVKDFLKTCQDQSLPLVLDLRENGGGDSNLAAELFFSFVTEDNPSIFEARSYALNHGNRDTLLNRIYDISPLPRDLENELAFEALKEKPQFQDGMTSWMVSQKKKYSTKIFTGPMITLISSNCVSACENLANRLKVAQRTVFVGTATSGTGFGYVSMSSSETKARDPFNLFEVTIPNQAFQSYAMTDFSGLHETEKMRGKLVPLSEISFLENSPTTPDITYELTAKDLVDFSDYRASLIDVMKKQWFSK